MRELIATNDLVLISYVEALLADQGIEAVVFDRNISLMEGSIGAFPRRVVVPEDAWHRSGPRQGSEKQQLPATSGSIRSPKLGSDDASGSLSSFADQIDAAG